MSIDEENRQWIWDCLLRTRDKLKQMTRLAESNRQAAIMMKHQLFEADNPVDFYEIELKETARYRAIKRIRRMSGLR